MEGEYLVEKVIERWALRYLIRLCNVADYTRWAKTQWPAYVHFWINISSGQTDFRYIYLILVSKGLWGDECFRLCGRNVDDEAKKFNKIDTRSSGTSRRLISVSASRSWKSELKSHLHSRFCRRKIVSYNARLLSCSLSVATEAGTILTNIAQRQARPLTRSLTFSSFTRRQCKWIFCHTRYTHTHYVWNFSLQLTLYQINLVLVFDCGVP